MAIHQGKVLHLVDSLGLGGTQAILRDYFGGRPTDRGVHLYGLRTVSRQMHIDHPNVAVNASPLRFSIMPLFDLRRIVRREGIGVLHCHLFRSQVFGYLLKRLFFPDIVLVFHEHGRVVGREGESGFEALMFRWFLRLAWPHVDRFICISDHTCSRLLKLIPGARPTTIVVSNPIPVYPQEGVTFDRDALRRDHGIPVDAFVVGFAARLIERKGWKDFLDAVALVSKRMPVHFLLAGDGEDRARAEAHIAAIGLADRGRMLGHIDWMEPFYECLDCFVMPSHWEPHGLAHLEAQGFGVPTVVARVPGLESTVHDGVDSLLFESGNVEALAACIERVAGDAALRLRLAAGGRANSARYTMEAFASTLDTIYASLERAR
jgi:glycosyltransferase involved in cell wall biosynthesis